MLSILLILVMVICSVFIVHSHWPISPFCFILYSLCFSLLPPDGNHDIPVFEEVPAGQFVDATPVKPPYRCDAVTNYFWGRAVDVQKVT